MTKVAPLLFIVAALLAAGVFLFGEDDPEGMSLEVGEAYEDEEAERAPELRTSDAARPGAGRRTSGTPQRKPPKADTPKERPRVFQGTVVDAATGKPVAGASLSAEPARKPCPRLSAGRQWLAGITRTPANGVPLVAFNRTGADGRFDCRALVPGLGARPHDVFAVASGYVDGMACSVKAGSDILIRLEPALPFEVTVTDPHGRAIEGARLTVRPGPETPATPGHAGHGQTDINGRGIVDGLAPGEVVLTVDHPEWMPTTTAPFDPAIDKTRAVELTPALRLRFTIRSDDAQGIRHPSLAWRTDGEPPHEGLLLLRVKPTGTQDATNAEVKSEAVRIPCDHRTVDLQIKAEGFATWHQPEPLPAAGGEREVIVVLTRDTALGSLEVVFQGPDGKPIELSKLGAGMPSITPLDDVEVGAVTMEAGASLWIKSLPAGRYEIAKRSPDFAPGIVVADVRAGDPTQVTMKLRPAAKLRVVFRAYERTTVQFRLRRGRELLRPYTEAKGTSGSQGAGPASLTAQGEEGALFTGLPGGSCTIEVTSPDLVASPRTVQLQEGETTEVEIDVRRR